MAVFVLIHGAWHGGWCWEELTPRLERLGHRVIAPDLPGMGADRTPPGQVTLKLWGEFVADIARAQNEPVILAGHSRGGIVISQAAERAPDVTKLLIYVTAALVPNGGRLWKLPEKPSNEDARLYVFSPDMATSTVIPTAAGHALYNTTDPVLAERAIARLGPEPMIASTTPVQLSDENYGRVPRVYVECLQDRISSVAAQRALVQAMPCREVITMDTDHSPFLSAPDELARHFHRLAS